MTGKNPLAFAILGHPNEGKSAVVSTLAEDDTVRVSPTPGETTRCRAFPVSIDGKEILRFIDTPGFQAPKQTLEWFRQYSGDPDRMIHEFIRTSQNDPVYRDECELLSPVADGAGIIYVADGSRPVRSDDKAEMEILRLTGKPRMAIINSKAVDADYTADWKGEFRKNFNATRVFNAHTATYSERIALLENLKAIDQDWQSALETVIDAFKSDWDNRNHRVASLIGTLVEDCLTYRIVGKLSAEDQESAEKAKLAAAYQKEIERKEKRAHAGIRKLYKHNIFDLNLPDQSILAEDLFSRTTWQALGLKPAQLAVAAGTAGGLLGIKADIAAAGLGFGVFTVLGSALGAGAALWGGRQMASARKTGLKLGGYQLQVGPNTNIQFLYILLDRALLFYVHAINWAHGRRDYQNMPRNPEGGKRGFSAKFDNHTKRICARFFKVVHASDVQAKNQAAGEFTAMVKALLDKI